MHDPAKLKAWYQSLAARNATPKDDFVSKIDTMHWTQEDVQKFGVDWKSVPCRAGGVRITHPTLPHGSPGDKQGKALKVRRTILPWYVSIQKDHEELEIIESGTWSMLHHAHLNMVPGQATPSGYSVKYGVPPFRSPFSTLMVADNPISKALIGQTRWDDPMCESVVRNCLTSKGYNGFLDLHRNYQANVVKMVAERWRVIRDNEMGRYLGGRSFFRNHDWEARPKPDEGQGALIEEKYLERPYNI
jgi:hypothetical protein